MLTLIRIYVKPNRLLSTQEAITLLSGASKFCRIMLDQIKLRSNFIGGGRGIRTPVPLYAARRFPGEPI